MEYGKTKLIRLLANTPREGWNNQKLKDLIDSLWRDPVLLRWSGFENAGGPDTLISWNATDKIFSIAPLVVTFGFYQYRVKLSFHKRAVIESINMSEILAEGRYIFFYTYNEELLKHVVSFIHNPTETEVNEIFLYKTEIANLYWDATANEALHFGDDRHGSEWNPQIHRYLHTAFGARRKSGLTITGTNFGGDGSDNAHAKFSIVGGTMLHDDFEMDIPSSSESLPILYQEGFFPRYKNKSGYAIYQLSSRACYNSGGAVIPAPDGEHVLYHIFATNEIRVTARKTISVMGRWHYETLAEAYAAAPGELDYALSWMPQQGRLHIATIIVQTADAYTNDTHSRIVAVWGESHPPVTIAEGSKEYLSITEKQELSIDIDTLIDTVSEIIETNNNTTIPEIIKSSIGFSRESWLIEDTSLTGVTQLSSWFVVAFNELVGNFKATVMVRDKITNAIITLQNTFGFDYTDALNEVGDDNAIITDIAISLALSVDTATNNLKAVVSGMTSNAKRIHFCFERCVLSQREIELAGTSDMALGMDGELNTAMELAGTAEMEIGMEAGIDSALELEGTSEIEFGAEGELLTEIPIYPVDYGLLYNWYAVADARNIAASGWRVGTYADYNTLRLFLAPGEPISNNTAGGKLKETGFTHWNSPNTGATNESNFNARGTGLRAQGTGVFSGSKQVQHLRTSTVIDAISAYAITLSDTSQSLTIYTVSGFKNGGPVRLVKESTTLSNGQTGTYTGNDGKIYRTICIGTQEWLADNLCETRFRDGSIIPWFGANAANYFTSAEWGALTTAGVCAYSNSLINVAPDFTFPTE